MARDFVVLVGAAHVDDPSVVLEGSSCLFLLAMIIMSLSIISMLIFACGDEGKVARKSGYNGGGGGCGGGGCGGGGCGGCGGGG